MPNPEQTNFHVSDAEFFVDAMVMVAAIAAVCLFAHRLLLMTVAVPVLLAIRVLSWAVVTRPSRREWIGEGLFFLLCIVLGAANDFNTVVRHGVYDYTVPVYFPEVTTIPVWMLLAWGLILRFMAAVAWYHRLSPPLCPRDTVQVGSYKTEHRWLKMAVLLILVLATRQAIYRYYLHPVFSWLPFAGAAALYGVMFGVSRHDLKVAAITLAAGPVVEMAFIHLAGLHRYHLGVLFGVPLWIALWWVVAVLVWKDISGRILAVIHAVGR